jgi:hypothetical protein
MSGQIVDASLVAAPRQRNTEAEKQVIKGGPRSRGVESQACQARWLKAERLEARNRPLKPIRAH